MSDSAPDNRRDDDVTEVEVWHASASADDPGPVESMCERYLSRDDLCRADLLRRPTSRNQHVVGRGMPRRLLAGEAVDPEAWPYEDEPGGKPRFGPADDPSRNLTFNVSHTEGLVLCGVCRQTRLIGIDVERRDRRIDLSMTQRYFATPEIEYVRQQASEPEARLAFLKIWTLKESFIKAIGTGLRTPLSDFAFEQIDSPQPTIRFLDDDLTRHAGGPAERWAFQSFEPRRGFLAAVAVLDPPAPTTLRLRSFDALVTSGD